MTSRLTLILFTALTLAACGKQEAPAPAAPVAETTPAATPTPAATEAATPAAATESAPNNNPIVPPQGPAPVLGTDYVEIAGGQPFQPGTGKIEVAEAFGYTCPHCASFEPVVTAWKAKLPADVNFVPVAAPFGGYWMPYAKAYYTAEGMGLVGKTHDAMFRAIHIERTLPVQGVTDEQIGAFYAKYGADAKAFASTMSSFAVAGKLKRAEQFLVRSGVEGTPTLVINGKYRITGGQGFEDVLRIADHLIAQERATSAPAAAAPATGTGG
ncbi:thiol:disulfide interchange protein DsbA/DsbL [Aerolutibacter ruishenii]|uniref:Thiol:disulfide interchange protein DsbA n=1 Tax=Aerolutibacter ruishenii TaxID=686800 RepID=A0A562LGT9_9GAMM|nr:thiol:disulfide interchange protein DsbA/DsbL [Lysobacter ruishenii]TWI06834.1 thiol:disulfide interchange protein DsbA [Lysobacter ruishenii]